MSLSVDAVTIDCRDPRLLADFWCPALDYRLHDVDDTIAEIKPNEAPGPTLLFQVVPEGKTVKNRYHLDLRSSGSMAAEVERMEALGATSVRRVDEGGSFWTLMTDPEGNEFCVLRGPEDGWTADPA